MTSHVPPNAGASASPSTTSPAASRDSGSKAALRSEGAGRPVSFGPLRGVYWKELRENAKYGAFLLLALGVFTLFALWNETRGFAGPLQEDSALFNQAMQILSAFSCAIVGLLLALLQTFNERVFDLRAFAMHRAITPSRLFLGKCLAALTIYGVVIGLPLLIFVGYAAWGTDGGLIFDVRFARPYAADFFVGWAYYFAGSLVAQRQARWYVSKVFPLALAIGVSVASFALPEFWQAMAAIGVLAGLLLAGAWQNFIRSGVATALGQPADATRESAENMWAKVGQRAGRWAMPVVMALGLTAAGTVLLTGDAGIVELLSQDSQGRKTGLFQEAEFSPPTHEEHYALLDNGLPVRVVTEYGDTLAKKSETWTPMAGQPQRESDHLSRSSGMGGLVLDPTTNLDYMAARQPYREGMSQIAIMTEGDHSGIAGAPSAQRWIYVRPKRYFIGFDAPTHQLIGTVGRSGFLPAGTAPEPFKEGTVFDNFLIDGNRIYQSNFGGDDQTHTAWHDLKLVFSAPAEENVRAMTSLGMETVTEENYHGSKDPTWGLFLADQHIYFTNWVNAVRQTAFSIPLEHPIEWYWIKLTHHVAAERISVWYIPIGDARGAQYVSTFTDEGKRVNQTTLPALPGPARRELSRATRNGVLAIGMIDSLRNPLLVDGIQRAYTWIMLGPAYHYHGFLFFAVFANGELPVPGEYYAGIMVPMALAAGITLCLARRQRYTVAGTMGWTLAALVLGPVGLLTFLFTQPLAARVRCGSCGKKRLVTRDVCEHCGAAAARPVRNGTEVFGER